MRAFDRGHSLRLIEAGVDYQIRETFESALAFGQPSCASSASTRTRPPRPSPRCAAATSSGWKCRWPRASRRPLLMRGNVATPQPAPLTRPKQGRALNEEAAEAIGEDA